MANENFNPELQQLKQNNPDESANRMGQQVNNAFGFPKGSVFLAWPKKPLSDHKPGNASGKSAPSQPHFGRKSSRSKGSSKGGKLRKQSTGSVSLFF